MFSRRNSRKHSLDMSCIFVHAGAGFHSRENEQLHLQACSDACKAAMLILKNGGCAVDAAEMAIKILEDREITNAGYGSNPNIDGIVECDAIIVDHLGRSGAAGAVAQVRNPVSLARVILDATSKSLSLHRVPPNFLCGEGATKFAHDRGLPVLPHSYLVSPMARVRWRKWKTELDKAENTGLAGCRSDLVRTMNNGQMELDPELNTFAQDIQEEESSRTAHQQNMLEGLYGAANDQLLSTPAKERRPLPSPPSSSSERKCKQNTNQARDHYRAFGSLNAVSSPSPATAAQSAAESRDRQTSRHMDDSSSFTTPLSTSSFGSPESEVESYIDPIGPPGMLENITRNPFANSTQKIEEVAPLSPQAGPRNVDHLVDPSTNERGPSMNGNSTNQDCWYTNTSDGCCEEMNGRINNDEELIGIGNDDRQSELLWHDGSRANERDLDGTARARAIDIGKACDDSESNRPDPTKQNTSSHPKDYVDNTSSPIDDRITDTIGAIAIDRHGRIACAASSGGIGMKHRGRVGPAALIGVGAAVIPAESEYDALANSNDNSSAASSARSSFSGLSFGWPLAADGASAAPHLTPEDIERQTTVAVVTSGTGEHMATTFAANTCAGRILRSEKVVPRGRARVTAQQRQSPSSFSRHTSPAASPSSVSSGSSFFSRSSDSGGNGTVELCTEDEALHSYIVHDFLAHPTVRNSPSAGAIGALAVKKTPEGTWMYFGHNTESFALASMHAGDAKPVCTMSRKSPAATGGGAGRAAAVAQGGRAIRWPVAGPGRR